MSAHNGQDRVHADDHGRDPGLGQDHHHEEHGHDDIDWDAMAAHLEREAELRVPFVEEALAWLRGLMLEGGCGPDTAERVMDLGSGPGVFTVLLARAFPQAEVVAVDGEPGLLRRVRDRAEREGAASNITVREARFPQELGGLGSADLIWTSNVVHHIGDQQAALDSLAAAVRTGGLLAVVERGLSPRYLPRDIGLGRPGLLARLEAANEERYTAMREALPGHTRVVEDWAAMLARAGMAPAGTRTFLTDLPAPPAVGGACASLRQAGPRQGHAGRMAGPGRRPRTGGPAR
ncbi:class I SAM-dependent methyltransferase [Streptomyces marispadix]|uniref:class I SAM-dependent methyltransferase n=1 Tax=Streptomyces marispadix TaxID=2922868 RepID=UPI0027E2209F|nr:class I SAM-dependent methyltransferase [Streptomyces marispadix]